MVDLFLTLAEGKTQRLELLLNFLERLASKITDAHHIVLVTLSELLNGIDACALEAVEESMPDAS